MAAAREFMPGDFPTEALADGFIKFRPYLGQCRFRDCRHDAEPGCALQAAVSAGQVSPQRLASYHQLRLALHESR